MSADNGIVVSKFGHKYYIKDACFSLDFTDEYLKDTSLVFTNKAEALLKAREMQKESNYEYGVRLLDCGYEEEA